MIDAMNRWRDLIRCLPVAMALAFAATA